MRSYRFDKKSYMVQISVTINVEMALYFTKFVYRRKTTGRFQNLLLIVYDHINTPLFSII